MATSKAILANTKATLATSLEFPPLITCPPSTQPSQGNGEWTVVRRRRQYPQHWRKAAQPATAPARPYIPYPNLSTYAQVVASSSKTSPATSRIASPATTRPTSPNTPPETRYFISPHSPSRLRFPPSSTYPKWAGRCFRCCRTGHTSAKCRNPKWCGKCWQDGHIASVCKEDRCIPTAKQTANPPIKKTPMEPMFDELLAGPYPTVRKQVPEDRPARVFCYIDRDEDYFHEVARLSNAVLISSTNVPLTPAQIVDIAVRTRLVDKEEISVVTQEIGSSCISLKLWWRRPSYGPRTQILGIEGSLFNSGSLLKKPQLTSQLTRSSSN